MTPPDAVTIRLDGQPAPQLRHRAVAMRRKDGTTRARTYEDRKTSAIKQRVALSARAAWRGEPSNGPIGVDILFVFRCPPSDRRVREPRPRRLHAIKPDVDNVAKLYLDALNGIVWADDSRIVDLRARKIIGAQDEPPHVVVTVWRVG